MLVFRMFHFTMFSQLARIGNELRYNINNMFLLMFFQQTSYADMLDLAVQHIRTLQDQVQVGELIDQPFPISSFTWSIMVHAPRYEV